jgi:bacillithiol synthase
MTRDRTVNFTCIPKISALFLDYLYDFPKVQSFYSSPFSFEQFKRESVAPAFKGIDHRLRLCEVLLDQNRSFGAHGRTLENLDRLKENDCLAIVTGQQVGLFTGPAYTIYKALTAVKLAAHYACRGIKTVPIFWMATEDHDIAEVDHCDVVDGDSVLSKVQYLASPEDSQRSVGRVAFLPSIESARAEFLGTLPSSEFKQQIDAILAASYYPGNSFARAFGQVMSALFANYGLILIDPQDERLKELVKPVFEGVVSHGERAQVGVQERSQRLVAEGYQAQVQLEPEISFLFAEYQEKRKALTREHGSFRVKGEDVILSREELLQWVRQFPQRLSPNVLLRPVVQDYLLPTFTYVGGPSEIAYLAQAAPLYEFLGGKMPIIFPRTSFSIIERKTGKVLDRYQLDFCDLFQGAEVVMKTVIEKTLDQTLARQFDEIETVFDQRLAELEEPLKKVDQTLADALKTIRQKVQYQVTHLRTKFVHAQTRHNETVTKQIEKALAILYPQKSLQERRLNIFYFLSRYGMDFMAQLYEEIDLSDQDHRLLYL